MSTRFHEMAAAPRTAARAERLAEVLPADSKEAKRLALTFWDLVLRDNVGASSAAGEGSRPPVLTDQEIRVRPVCGVAGARYLEWHAVVTFTPIGQVSVTMIVTSVDEPGVYRVDFVLLGQGRAVTRKIRERVSREVMVAEDRVTVSLSDEEAEAFRRIGVSTSATTRPDGSARKDDNLVLRLTMDRIPMDRLQEVAPRIRDISMRVGDVVVDEMTKPTVVENFVEEAYGSYDDSDVVKKTGSIEYLLNDKSKPSYITAFDVSGKIGYLSLSPYRHSDKKTYLRIVGVSVSKGHQRQGIATTMYQIALRAALAAGYAGLLSRDEDVGSPRAIVSIRRRLGMRDVENDGRWVTPGSNDTVSESAFSFEALLVEDVLPAVERATEILGDRRAALAVAEHDPYPDKRMTPTVAAWIKGKKVQSAEEHAHDVKIFKDLRARLKGLRVPATDRARSARVKELLAYDATAARAPHEIAAWNAEVARLVDPDADLSPGDLPVVGRHGGFTMYRLDSPEACEAPLVKNAMSWCVTKEYFGEYGGPPYFAVVRDSDKSPFAMVIPAHFEKDPDEAVRNGTNSGRLSALDLRKIRPLVRLALPEGKFRRKKTYLRAVHADAPQVPKKAPASAAAALRTIRDRALAPGEWPAGEAAIAADSGASLAYARDVIGARWPEGETTIAKEVWVSLAYARDVIKGRFEKAEATIAKNAWVSLEYARSVIKGRFHEGEAAIAADSGASLQYARDVVVGRWSEGEATIATDTLASLNYAKDVIKGRFPAGEEVIAKDAWISLKYAANVIKGRFPAGEEVIAKDALIAHDYAANVIKGRFEKAEATIAKDAMSAVHYARVVIKGRFEKAEATIAKHATAARLYARYVIEGRFEKGEFILDEALGSVKGLTFRSEQRGWHHGQSDETIYAMIDGAKVGRLEYNVYQGEASIDYIHVDEAHRRKGVGRALFQELKKAHRKVRWTATTPDGEALRQAVDPPRPKKAQAEDPRKSFSEKDYDLVLSKIHDARSSGDKRAEARLKRLVSRMNTWDRNLENHRLLKKGLLFGQDAFKARSPGAKDKPSLREV